MWQGSAGTSLAFWMQTTIEGWLIYDLTGSPIYLSMAALARSGPMLVLSPFAGVLADRVDRRAIIITTQFLALALAFLMATLVFTGAIEAWQLLVAAFVSGIATAASVPARYGLTAAVVPKEHLANAIAVHATTVGGSRIVGPQIAGVLIGTVGAGASYLIQAGTFLWAIFKFRQIRPQRPTRRTTDGGFLGDLLGGFRIVVGDSRLRGVFVLGVVFSVLIFPFSQFLPMFAKDVLEIGAPGLGLLMGANGIGGVAGSFAAAASSNYRRRGLLLQAAGLLMGTAVLFFSFSQSVWLSIIALILIGIGGGVIMATTGAIMQLLVSDEYRGRIGSLQLITWGLMPVGTLPLGWIAHSTGISTALGLFGGLSVVVVALTLVLMPSVRRLQC